MKIKGVDKIFFSVVVALIVLGFVVFVSASLGVLAKNETKFYSILLSQLFLGLVGGGIAMWVMMSLPYQWIKKYSFILFILSLVITSLVFVPGIGFEHGGARRWIDIIGISFQPVELLKIGFIAYFAGWLSWVKGRVSDVRMGIIPLFVMLGLVAVILLNQPDHKSLILLSFTGAVMLFVSGLPWKQIAIVCAIVVVGFGAIILTRPYVRDRVTTFFDQASDPQGSSYQIRQSLIALGSGGFWGRGFGHSIQKFSYLPEPHGDTIFAVIGEEFGFIGTTFFVVLFSVFCLRGLQIATLSPDPFGRLFVVGLVILMTAQSFLHIASTIRLFPLTGVPLVFISHGGTALLFSCIASGIILNISKNIKKTV